MKSRKVTAWGVWCAVPTAGIHTICGSAREAKEYAEWCEGKHGLIRLPGLAPKMDDGLPARMDRLELSKSMHREKRLKSLGNAIVPQVATEIMRAIKEADKVIYG